jgi:hypothetical protein
VQWAGCAVGATTPVAREKEKRSERDACVARAVETGCAAGVTHALMAGGRAGGRAGECRRLGQ